MSLLDNLGGRRAPIGLDLGTRSIKVVQLSGHATPTVVCAMTIPRTREGMIDAEEASRMREALNRYGFHGRRVAVAARPADVVSSVLDVPTNALPEVSERICRSELSRILHTSPDQCECVCWPVPNAGPYNGGTNAATSQVLAMGVSHAAAERLINVLETAGFIVERVDLGSVAVVECSAQELQGSESESSAAGSRTLLVSIDLGWEAATATFAQGDAVVYERRMQSAGIRVMYETLGKAAALTRSEIDAIVASESSSQTQPRHEAVVSPVHSLVVPHAKRLAAELRDELTTCVEYLASRSQQIDSVELVLTGGGAEIAVVRDEVREALRASEAGAGYRFREPPMGVTPALAIAAALSARAYAVRTPQGVAA